MPANLENSAVTTGLEKVSFHSNPKERQVGFRKGRGTRDQIANIRWVIEKAREFQKNTYFYFIDCAKAFNSMDHNKLENSPGEGNTRPPDLPPERSVRGQEATAELDTEQQTGSRLGKECMEAACCHPAYLTYMQNAACEMPGWMKHKLESAFP